MLNLDKIFLYLFDIFYLCFSVIYSVFCNHVLKGIISMEKPLSQMTSQEIIMTVAKKYGEVASNPNTKFNFPVGRKFAESIGYPLELLNELPSQLWESFTGAGNPQPFVDIKPGETILDLGCGAGLDLCLYGRTAGVKGKVYGLDVSEEMVAKARRNMELLKLENVELIHAFADNIPLPDESIDIVTSNGIYNLSPDKKAVIREVVRVLRPGGRTIFAEIILKSQLPEEIRKNINDWFRCIGGALAENDFLKILENEGLKNPQILWKGRNARTSHELSLCAVIRAEK